MKNISLESSADPEVRARRFPAPAGAPHALVSPESSARRINNETPAADEGERAAAAAEETAGPDAGAAPREFSDGHPSGSPSPEEPGTPRGSDAEDDALAAATAAVDLGGGAYGAGAGGAEAGGDEVYGDDPDGFSPSSPQMGAGGLAYLQNWGPGGPLGMHDANLGPEQLETVHCPQALVGRLIGKQGDTIKDLQRRSGARIQIDQNFPEGTPRVVTVEGSAQCVALGVQLVRSLIGNSPAVGNGNPGKMTTFECPKALVGRVIGKGGETINELQRRSGARIQIEQRVPEGAPCIIEARRGVRVFVAASLLVASAGLRARARGGFAGSRARPSAGPSQWARTSRVTAPLLATRRFAFVRPSTAARALRSSSASFSARRVRAASRRPSWARTRRSAPAISKSTVSRAFRAAASSFSALAALALSAFSASAAHDRSVRCATCSATRSASRSRAAVARWRDAAASAPRAARFASASAASSAFDSELRPSGCAFAAASSSR